MGNSRKILGLVLVIVFLTSLISIQPAVKAQTKTITVPDDYPTIREAVDNANAGDMVFVRSGNYTLDGNSNQMIDGLIINKTISLVGENRDDTILAQIPYKYGGAAIKILADNVTISGLTITGGKMNNLLVTGSGCTISNNNIINSYEHSGVNGIGVGGSNNVIFGNNIFGNGGFGMYVTSSNTIILNNSITNNSDGIIIDSSENITLSQNNVSENNGTGIILRWNGPFYIEENNITNNKGFGIQFGEGTNNATVSNNNIVANQYGFNLLNYITNPSGIVFLGFGNQVFYNNIVNNQVNANVEHASIFTANVSAGEGNGTDVVLWDNGIVGNYWGDYNGSGSYIIDENNIDHYPLTQPVDVSSIAPTPTATPYLPTDRNAPHLDPTYYLVPISVIIAVVIVLSAVLYSRHRKTPNLNKAAN